MIVTDTLPLMEDFYTIQGEGYYQGYAAYFIRLAGCDVGCVWCDVKESWDASMHPRITIEEMVSRASNSGTNIVVVTGGEPLMYNLTSLTKALHAVGLKTNIETSGVYPLSGEWDWICFSPKKFKTPHEGIFLHANELKVVIYHPSDLAWAEGYASKMNPDCECFLQPEWSKEKEMLPLIVDYVKANPRWKVSLQIHKYMNIP